MIMTYTLSMRFIIGSIRAHRTKYFHTFHRFFFSMSGSIPDLGGEVGASLELTTGDSGGASLSSADSSESGGVGSEVYT